MAGSRSTILHTNLHIYNQDSSYHSVSVVYDHNTLMRMLAPGQSLATLICLVNPPLPDSTLLIDFARSDTEVLQ